MDIRSTESVSSEDATASMVAKIITEQLGRVRVGLAFNNGPGSNDAPPTEEDPATRTTINSESSHLKMETGGPASWYVRCPTTDRN
jgi:hypothetical protein